MGAYLSLSGSERDVGWGGGGRLFEAGRLLTFSASRMGANSRLGAFSNTYGNSYVDDTKCVTNYPASFLYTQNRDIGKRFGIHFTSAS